MVTAYDEGPPMDTSNHAHHDLSSRTIAISVGYVLLVAQKMRGSVRVVAAIASLLFMACHVGLALFAWERAAQTRFPLSASAWLMGFGGVIGYPLGKVCSLTGAGALALALIATSLLALATAAVVGLGRRATE
jgi:vacuolar-type H+-ATPase subunit I/STV1